MGYLRRRVSRQRCGAEVAIAERRQAEALSTAWGAAPTVPPDAGGTAREVYLRFAVGTLDRRSHQQRGLFRAAGDIEASLAPDVRRELREICGWFNRNLTVPSGVPPTSTFWFRSTSADCVTNVWQLVTLFRGEGIPVWMMRTARPGRIAYEDEHQVAAIPFLAEPRRRPRII
jgi:hypothetical protein